MPPSSWSEPTPVAAGTLLAELIAHLGDDLVDIEARVHAEAVIFDLLEPLTTATIEMQDAAATGAPLKWRAPFRRPRTTLVTLKIGVATSERAPAPSPAAFLETGVGFGRWRTMVRMQAAAPMLAEGTPVSRVARSVGYATTSAFIAAFRRETGLTPAVYFKERRASIEKPAAPVP